MFSSIALFTYISKVHFSCENENEEAIKKTKNKFFFIID